MTDQRLLALFRSIEELYANSEKELLFHGWHHIVFVYKKSKVFAESLGVDSDFVQACALVHDLNYFVDVKSDPGAGDKFRKEYLTEAGYSPDEIAKMESVIVEEDMKTRDAHISKEAMALSDADTLFKILPTTPILFSSRYIEENNADIKQLANRVLSEQLPLLEKGIYFYSDLAKEKYLELANTHMQLWKQVSASLDDEDVIEMLKLAGIVD